jgi:hypothetical protein
MDGLIRAFLVRFQKIDSRQQDGPEMPGFPRYQAAVRPAFRWATAPVKPGGKRP